MFVTPSVLDAFSKSVCLSKYLTVRLFPCWPTLRLKLVGCFTFIRVVIYLEVFRYRLEYVVLKVSHGWRGEVAQFHH